MSGATPSSGHVGAAGEAAVMARLLREGFIVARPMPDAGVDIVVLSPDMTRAASVQVKTASKPSINLSPDFFAPVDVALVIVWLSPGGEEIFVFDGLKSVETFLGTSATTKSWLVDRRWLISDMGSPGYALRLRPYKDDWNVIRRRLGLPRMTPAATGAYRLTLHARERIEAGEVREDWIAETLTAPDRTAPDPRRPEVTLAWRCIPAFDNRTLRVAYRLDNGQMLVITAFFDRGAKL